MVQAAVPLNVFIATFSTRDGVLNQSRWLPPKASWCPFRAQPKRRR